MKGDERILVIFSSIPTFLKFIKFLHFFIFQSMFPRKKNGFSCNTHQCLGVRNRVSGFYRQTPPLPLLHHLCARHVLLNEGKAQNAQVTTKKTALFSPFLIISVPTYLAHARGPSRTTKHTHTHYRSIAHSQQWIFAYAKSRDIEIYVWCVVWFTFTKLYIIQSRGSFHTVESATLSSAPIQCEEMRTAKLNCSS